MISRNIDYFCLPNFFLFNSIIIHFTFVFSTLCTLYNSSEFVIYNPKQIKEMFSFIFAFSRLRISHLLIDIKKAFCVLSVQSQTIFINSDRRGNVVLKLNEIKQKVGVLSDKRFPKNDYN